MGLQPLVLIDASTFIPVCFCFFKRMLLLPVEGLSVMCCLGDAASPRIKILCCRYTMSLFSPARCEWQRTPSKCHVTFSLLCISSSGDICH